MNENIDLTKILKDCPEGWKLYSNIFGNVYFDRFQSCGYPVLVKRTCGITKIVLYYSFSQEGKYKDTPESECCLFPSKEQRDWSKFTAPWYKKDKFDPKTLQAFDKILVRDSCFEKWKCGFFSHINDNNDECPYYTVGTCYGLCIPYNDETKHLVGTTEEAPEYYRYWDAENKELKKKD